MSARMPWFRMYTDFLNDPKMIGLAFEDQRHFIGVLALKSDGAIDDTDSEDLLNRIVAQRLWIDHGIIRDVKKRLKDAGLIDADWQPLAWNKRQFVSDRDSTAAERKRRERAAKAAAAAAAATDADASRVTDCDSHKLVTRQDTDTDTESDTELKEAKASSSSGKLPPCPHGILIDLFGKHLPTMPQPKPELWTGAKATATAARWKWVLTATKKSGARYAETREDALNFFERFFDYVNKSDFLTGRNEKWTRCNLSWLMKAENFAKVLEGHYENESAA